MRYTVEYKNESGKSITFSLKTGFLITDFPLLSGLPVSVSTSQSINQIGGTVESQLIDPKNATITGVIQGYGVEAKKKLLDTIRPLEKAKFTVNDTYSIDVVITETPTVERRSDFPQFQFGVLAPYPFWSKVTENIISMAGISGMFKFPWNITETYQFGVLMNSYFTNIYNGGQVPTFYDLEITSTGSTVNPIFENIHTGETLKLNKMLSAGEKISISIRPDNIMAESSIDGDIEGLIDIESTLFSLRPGDNVIKYDADSGRDYLNIMIRFSDKFAGVVV